MAKGRSLSEFQEAFPDEECCAAFLVRRRWPNGFVCPGCAGRRAAALKSRAYTYECANCGRQTSITAGTAMHRTKAAADDVVLGRASHGDAFQRACRRGNWRISSAPLIPTRADQNRWAQ